MLYPVHKSLRQSQQNSSQKFCSGEVRYLGYISPFNVDKQYIKYIANFEDDELSRMKVVH